MFNEPNGKDEALLALKEIDDLKRTVNRQLNSLKDAVDGDIETKIAHLSREAKREKDEPHSHIKTLELMLEMETKLNQKQNEFENYVKSKINMVNTKFEHASRVSSEVE